MSNYLIELKNLQKKKNKKIVSKPLPHYYQITITLPLPPSLPYLQSLKCSKAYFCVPGSFGLVDFFIIFHSIIRF